MRKGKSINVIALAQKISRIAVWQIRKKYEQFGDGALNTHKPGRLYEPLNEKFYDLVIAEWKNNKCGARKLYEVLKRKGFSVSRRKIEQVLVAEGFQQQVPKRSKPRKYKRYEWPIPNLMWHTDWHVIKSEKLKGKQFISYIDDCSRKIMAHGVFDNATEKNSIAVLYTAIAEHEVIPFELNSDRGSQFIPNKFDKHGKANHAFQEAMVGLGIIFIPSKKRHPQTNGKNEKWFDIFEKEFDERFKTVDEFVRWYNDERLSEAIDYLTPNEAYKKRL